MTRRDHRSSAAIDRRARERNRSEARAFIERRGMTEVGAMLDAMILGDFDWRDYFADRPPPGFVQALYEAARESEEAAA